MFIDRKVFSMCLTFKVIKINVLHFFDIIIYLILFSVNINDATLILYWNVKSLVLNECCRMMRHRMQWIHRSRQIYYDHAQFARQQRVNDVVASPYGTCNSTHKLIYVRRTRATRRYCSYEYANISECIATFRQTNYNISTEYSQ